ncbi:MAG: FecR domain-containing protein [Chthoniobacterales bacterium]|jgi:hypothetical protein|nr:FecR domain-containing protein [Chthoniobacterales bacterium]
MKQTLLTLLTISLLLPLADVVNAAQNMVPGHIRAVKVEGTAWQIIAGSGAKERLKEGDFIRQGNAVETAANSKALLLFENGSTINLQPSTKFSIEEFLIDPFDAKKVDYQKIKSEPSTSVTKVSVDDGTILFDMPKLHTAQGSRFDMSNPVGTAGIRGTAGYLSDNSMGVTEGQVQFSNQNGQTQNFNAGQSTGFSPNGSFAPPPSSSEQNMNNAKQNSQSVGNNIQPEAFEGAAPRSSQAADSLTPEQKETLEQAAEKGEEALVEAVSQLAKESPDAAAAIAAAATELTPSAAVQIATAATLSAPDAAVAIAQSVAQVAPQQAQAIAAAVSSAAPNADTAAISSAAQQGADESASSQSQTQGDGGGGSTGGTAAPASSGGFGGGGGSGGGNIYSN